MKYNGSTDNWYYCREGYNDQGKYKEIYVDYNTSATILNLGTPTLGQAAKFRYWTSDNSIKNKGYNAGELEDITSSEFVGNVTLR